MAVTAREVLLIFRAQNYMGQAIRRVGADVGSLSRAQQLAQARQGLTNTRQNLLNRRTAIETERRRIAALTKSQGATAALNDAHAVQVQRLNAVNRSLDMNAQKLSAVSQLERRLKFQNFADGAAKVEHAGRAIQMFGIITGAAMGYAADKAAQFNTQATIAAAKVKAPGMTVGQIQQNASQIQAGLTKLLTSGKAVVSPTDLTQGVYRTLSGLQLPGNRNQQIKESINLVKQFQEVVKANFGMTSMDQVTQAAITTMRDFGFSVKNVGSALNTMQAAEKYGRMTMGEFLSTFNQAAPAARAAGYSFKQMSGTIAYLSTKFPSVQTAATGYARLLQTLAQNAMKFNQAGYQVTNKAGTQLLPLDQIIGNFIKKTPQLAKGGVVLQNFFKQVTGQTGYIQARRVFTFLAQDLHGLDKVTNQVAGDQHVLAKSVQAAAKSPGVKWQEFKNQLQGIMLVLGAGAIPAFKAFAAPIEAAIKWFDNLNPRTQKFIGYMVAMIGIGAALGGTLIAVTAGLARMGAILSAGMFTKLAEEEGSVSLASAGMLGAVGLIIFAYFKWHKQTMAVVNALGGLRTILAGVISYVTIKTALNLASAIYKIRDAEVAMDMANPFLAIAVGLTMLAVLWYQKWNTMKKGAIISMAFIYGFFMKMVNGMIGAWNNFINFFTFGLSKLTGVGQIGSVSETGPFGAYMAKLQAEYTKLKAARNLIKDSMKTHAPVPFNIYRHAHPDEPKKQAEADYKKYSQGLLNYALRNPMKPLKPPPGSSAAVMQHYKEQLQMWERLKRAVDQQTTKVKHLAKAHADANAAAKLYGTTASQAFRRAYNEYVKALKAAKADPTNIQKQIDAQNALMQLQAVASKQQLAAARKAADAVVAGNKTIAQSTQVTFQNVLDSIQGMYNNFLSSEQNIFGTLFQGPFMSSPAMQNYTQWGGKPTGQQLKKDLHSQISQFRTFHRDLNRLQRQGAPAQLIQQLMDLGPSALPQIQALLKMSHTGLEGYFKMFRTAQNMIQRQTMRDLRAQLNQYRKFGNQVALAIVAGLQDQNATVTNALKKMIHEMFPGLKGSAAYSKPTTHATTRQPRAHGGHAPTGGATHRGHLRRYYRRRPPSPPLHTRSAYHGHTKNMPLFVDYVRGPQFPLNRQTSTATMVDALDRRRGLFKQHFGRELKQAQPLKVWIVGMDKKLSMGEHHQHDHYHVDAGKGSSVDTQVRHTAFRNRHKHPRQKFTGDRYNL